MHDESFEVSSSGAPVTLDLHDQAAAVYAVKISLCISHGFVIRPTRATITPDIRGL